jgi:hypothetical protein
VEVHRVVRCRDSHIFSRQSADRWRWGCQSYAPAALCPPERFLVLISRVWVDPRAIVWLEGLAQLKKSNEFFGNGTRDLPAFSIVPQPTTLPRARQIQCYKANRFAGISWFIYHILLFLLNCHHIEKCFKQILCLIKDVCKLTSLLRKQPSVVYVWSSQLKSEDMTMCCLVRAISHLRERWLVGW